MWMLRLPGVDQRGGNMRSPPPLHEIIITSMQPAVFGFHLSFNQHSLFISLRVGPFHYELSGGKRRSTLLC